MSAKRNRTYTEEFKKDAIRLALRSNSSKNAAESLGIPEGTLNTWIRNNSVVHKKCNNADAVDLSEELKKLRKENSRLREEKEILKKAATFFAKESK